MHLELPGVRQEAFGVTWCQAGCIWSYLVSGRMHLELPGVRQDAFEGFGTQGRVHFQVFHYLGVVCTWSFCVASRESAL